MVYKDRKIPGYLPNEVPPIGEMIILGFQHVLTMFPATVFCALFTGFHVSTVLFVAGMATIVALCTFKMEIGKFIPLYYGSSFSYLTAYLAITNAEWGVPASDELISTMQAGILVTGVINIVVGFIDQSCWKRSHRQSPSPDRHRLRCCGSSVSVWDLQPWTWLAQIGWWRSSPLVVTILFSVYLRGKGFVGMIPILLGAIVGYLVSHPLRVDRPFRCWGCQLVCCPPLHLPDFHWGNGGHGHLQHQHHGHRHHPGIHRPSVPDQPLRGSLCRSRSVKSPMSLTNILAST